MNDDLLQLLNDWGQPILRGAHVLLIVFLAWLAQRIVTRGMASMGRHYPDFRQRFCCRCVVCCVG